MKEWLRIRYCKAGMVLARLVGMFTLFGLAACTYQGEIDNPLTMKATWFSYLNGDDIRRYCGEGSPTQFRIVYNGVYSEQLRSYEVLADRRGGALLTARVREGSNIASLRVSGLSDLLAPWRWQKSEATLSPAEANELGDALVQSGYLKPAPEGLRLHSLGFYWVVAGCNNGVFHFNAWSDPSERYDALTFPAVLLSHDETGRPLNPARKIYPGDRLNAQNIRESNEGPTFTLEVGTNGLKGVQPLI